MIRIAKYFSVFLISTVKFVGGGILGAIEGLSVLETTIFTFLGTMTTISLIAIFGNTYRTEVGTFFSKIKSVFYDFQIYVMTSLNLFSDEKRQDKIEKINYSKKPKRFTKAVRLAVKTWQKFGVFGVAVLTPIILSPIGGAVLAVSFRVKTRKILINMAFVNLIAAFILAYVLIEFQDILYDWFGIRLH